MFIQVTQSQATDSAQYTTGRDLLSAFLMGPDESLPSRGHDYYVSGAQSTSVPDASAAPIIWSTATTGTMYRPRIFTAGNSPS
ncbi:hypothetical protein F4554_005580 [Actinopolymorpha rutila]|uniref:Uncharacterized protein n=1 Tax=Actinopolymorpha rutila TaxID=446787 RepID=A0A852ZN12_9ACTN|nr:hypothetical protein [Actinopolymorpha rutila]